MKIRLAGKDDYGPVNALLARAGLPALPDPGAGHECWVAIADSQLAGAVALETAPPHGLLRSAVTHPDLRGRGIASALIRAALERAADLGLASVFLLTESAPEFFARRGFRPVSRSTVPDAIRATEEFHTFCPASAEVMRLDLDQSGS